MLSPSLKARWKRWRRTKYHENLEAEAQKYLAPMPSLRKALTISHTTDPHLAFPGLENQSNSAFFNRLSLDIRRVIYEYVVGSKCLHIVRKGKRLGYLLCQAQTPGSHERDACWGYENHDGTFRFRDDLSGRPTKATLPWDRSDWKVHYRTDGGLLPLLVSCRRIYSEAVETLYTHNQFCFTDEGTWAAFRSAIPSHRLSLVRSLHIQLMNRNIMPFFISRNIQVPPRPDFFSKEEYWIKFWESVGNLEGLRVLEVNLVRMPQFCYHRFRRWTEHTWQTFSTASEPEEEYRDVLLDPLRKITGLDEFRIELPVFHGVRDGDPFFVTCPEWIEGGRY